MNNLPIDNSEANLVLLSYEDHVKVHKLTILCAGSPELKSKMGFAVKRLLKGQSKGIHHTEETRRKMSESQKGKTKTEEHRRKLSDALKGENNPNFGKHFSEEHSRKMSESLKGKLKGKSWRLIDGKRVWFSKKEAENG